jgi:ElaB protein
MENSTDNKLNLPREGVTQIGKDLRSDAHGAIDKAVEKIPATADRLASSAHAGVDKVADTVEGASHTLVERTQQLGVAYKRMAETGRGYVRTSPAISVLLAAAAGYGLSKLFSSRK